MIDIDRALHGARQSTVSALSALMLPLLRLLTLVGGLCAAACLIVAMFTGALLAYRYTAHGFNILMLSGGCFVGFYCANAVLHAIINRLYQITEYGSGV